jgi:glutathione S-transferase
MHSISNSMRSQSTDPEPSLGTIELYHALESICSERVRMTLHEKGISEWVSHEIKLFEDEQFNPSYLKLNPKGQVPTLVHNGSVVRESSIICDYLDKICPLPPLKPSEPSRWAQMQEWIKFSDEVLYQSVSSFSFSMVFRDRLLNKSEQARETHFGKQPDIERTHRQRSCVALGPLSPYALRAVVAWEKTTSQMEDRLGSAGPWLMGEQFTLAEIALAPFFTRVADLQLLPIFIENRPNVGEWWARIQSRPSFAAAEISCGSELTPAYLAAGRRYGPDIRKLLDHYRSSPYECGRQFQ